MALIQESILMDVRGGRGVRCVSDDEAERMTNAVVHDIGDRLTAPPKCILSEEDVPPHCSCALFSPKTGFYIVPDGA